ncbi:MAG: hypothetical protein HZB16_02845 [Armatimonadetes bacterium]|nr:hypothetical protein [Armatimonadota bacterium]
MISSIDLNGAWHLRFDDGERGGPVSRMFAADADLRCALPAMVPGEVHLDLMNAGLLAEPNEGLNVLGARWVEETRWHYRRAFEAPALAAGQRAVLRFGGLDLAAVIYLNGREVGRHANAFYPCVCDVTSVLVEGVNVLVVEIESGLQHVGDKPSDGYGIGRAVRLHKRHWLRKTQSEAAWDWSPRLLNVGIHGDVSLEIWGPVRVDQFAVLTDLTPDLSEAWVTGRVAVDAPAGTDHQVRVEVEMPELNVSASRETRLQGGQARLQARLDVFEPELWWPIGQGEQRRYAVRTSVYVDDELVASDERLVGFRRVVVNQDEDPEGGRFFTLEVNGRRIFAKGGNFVPADLIPARLDRERYATLVDRAIESNFNFLRIWGGGLYEHDDFYDICDERGILVWQEFIFACGKYPANDEAFLADIKREAVYQIRRLARHPSLVVWCGNNEMEWGNWGWGYEQGVSYPDYALFHLVLPRLLADEDGTRYYQPSSPYSPDLQDPNADLVGDQHPWSVGFADTDFRKYREMACRFPNEGGILGPTALPTLRACLPAGAERHGSFAWEQHDNSVAYWGPNSYPDEMIKQWVGKDPTALSLEEYCYWAGLVQGEGLREYIENFHRRMPHTSSAIFWMYNDVWPAVRSWTTVDYYLRRTPAFWSVRRAMAPVATVVAIDGSTLHVYGVNETAEPIEADLRFGIMGLDGGRIVDRTRSVDLEPLCSTRIATVQLADWLFGDPDQDGSMAFAQLSVGGELVSRSRLLMPYFKDIRWPQPGLTVKVEDGFAVFESDTFVWGVCLDLNGETPLADNFFDVWPGIAYRLPWTADEPPQVLFTGNLV